ncbi:MAG: hypothetical protein KAI94_13040 [Anaerolineales bacterium]|nr:hypothetical protein [Anaerolineales bacterium]
MPDYNPDREGHVKHKWIVHNATQNRNFKGVKAGDKDMLFNREGRFLISDPVVANEIRNEHPRDVTVTRMRYPDVSDRGHNYFHVCPAMPWHEDEDDNNN